MRPIACATSRAEHLLLSQFHDGPAARALVRLGAGESQVRDAITAVLEAAGPTPREITRSSIRRWPFGLAVVCRVPGSAFVHAREAAFRQNRAGHGGKQ